MQPHRYSSNVVKIWSVIYPSSFSGGVHIRWLELVAYSCFCADGITFVVNYVVDGVTMYSELIARSCELRYA